MSAVNHFENFFVMNRSTLSKIIRDSDEIQTSYCRVIVMWLKMVATAVFKVMGLCLHGFYCGFGLNFNISKTSSIKLNETVWSHLKYST